MKAELLERLLHESECTYLDFKQAQYPFSAATPDEVKSELLKDILALANADKPGDGYVLIGTEEIRGARAKIHGVTVHLQDHELQQFVNSKTQRPLVFSYEVVPCDGTSIGVIRVPVQQRPLFLKNDFGKLRKSIVYYRLGSSTKDANPDDLWRWGQEFATRATEPTLELQFAQIRRPTVVGGSSVTKEVGLTLLAKTRNTSPVPATELAKLSPARGRMGFKDEDYWKEFSQFLRSGLLFAPIGLALKITGGSTASDIRVMLTPQSNSKVIVLDDKLYPGRPLNTPRFSNGGLYASHTRFPQEDIEVQEQAGEYKILWNIPKALPHLPVFSEGMFYVGASESGPVEFQCTIFAENLRRPIQTTLSVTVEKEFRDLTLEEIQKYSEAFTLDDNISGRGRVA